MKYRVGDLTIDTGRQTVSRGAAPIALPKLPYDLLIALVRATPNVVSLDELMRQVWPGVIVSPETVSQRVKLLRDALDDDSRAPRYIGGLRGRGYQVIAEVTELADIEAVPPVVDPLVKGAGCAGAEQSANATTRKDPPWFAIGALIVIGLICVGWIVRQARHGPTAETSHIGSGKVVLAVLPFQNLSNDPEQEYLSDGLTEETITDLGELSPERLGIIARTSAMMFKHSQESVTQIGQSLGADYLLAGSIRREGNAVRVSAQLIRVSDQSHLWAHSYDRELTGLLALQKELGRAIAQQVQVQLAPNYAGRSAEKYVPTPEAYELYLQGLYYLGKRSAGDLRKSIDYFERSTAVDGGFALAYAGLASAQLALGFLTPKESYPKAAAAASRALDLDDGLAEAHAVLGAEKAAFEYDWRAAESQLTRAIALNPNSAYSHFLFSVYYLTPIGRSEQAILEMRKGLALDPLSPVYNANMAQTFYFARQYQTSLQQYRKALQLSPDFFVTHAQLVWLHVELDDYPSAIAEMSKTRLLTGTSPQRVAADESALKKAFAAQGSQGFWQQVRVVEQDGWFPGGFFDAEIAARLGETDVALEMLQRDYQQRFDYISVIKVDPFLDSLRSDPRFIALLRSMGLDP